MSLQTALENFCNSNDLIEAIKSSTRAGWGGSGYSVELFEDGQYRVLWNNQIGDLYRSPGFILGIPQLNEVEQEEWAKLGDEAIEFYAPDFIEDLQDKLDGRLMV